MTEQPMENDFLELQSHFRDKCQKCGLIGDAEDWFLPHGKSSYALQDSDPEFTGLMKLIFSGTNGGEEVLQPAWKRITASPGLRTILLTVICDGSLSMLHKFRSKFLNEECEKTDDDLPFELNTAKAIFDEEGCQFYKVQFSYAAAVFREGQYGINFGQYLDQIRMPYMEENKIGGGAFGTVFRVKICGGHFISKNLRMRNMEPLDLVRKDFFDSKKIDQSRNAFKREDRILRELVNASDCPSSIMTSLCSFVRVTGTTPVHSILFPPAICDLNDYFSNNDNRPRGEEGKLNNFRRMIGLAEGLEWLNKKTRFDENSNSFKYFKYYHCDLRPKNILVCKSDSSEGDGVIFKISDFGSALSQKIHIDTRRESDSQIMQEQPHAASFAAPEMSHGQLPSSTSDVWSFGCILLLVLVFNSHSCGGICSFIPQLLHPTPQGSEKDTFYEEEGRGSKKVEFKVNHRVLKCIKSLRDHSIHESDKVLGNSLNLLERKIFIISPKKRMKIGKVVKSLRECYNDKGNVTPKEVLREHPSVKQIKYCAQSPQGEYELFYIQDFSMLAWLSDRPALSSESGPLLLNPLTRPDNKTGTSVFHSSECCGSNSVCQVVSIEGSLECNIYRIPPGDNGEGMTYINLEGLEPGSTEQVAISPNGELLAVICKISENTSMQIFMFEIETLGREMAKVGKLDENDQLYPNVSDKGIFAPSLNLIQKGMLEQTHYTKVLRFSGDSKLLYHAFIKDKSRDNSGGESFSELVVNIWDTRNGGHTCNREIEDKSPSFVRNCFLTCVTPFNRRRGFLAITYERWILHEPMEDEIATTGEHFEPRNKPILKTVLITPDDNWAVFLGGRHSLEIYGAKVGALDKLLQLDIEGPCTYDPSTDKACILVDNRRTKHLLLTSRNARSKTFDLTRLFSPSVG